MSGYTGYMQFVVVYPLVLKIGVSAMIGSAKPLSAFRK